MKRRKKLALSIVAVIAFTVLGACVWAYQRSFENLATSTTALATATLQAVTTSTQGATTTSASTLLQSADEGHCLSDDEESSDSLDYVEGKGWQSTISVRDRTTKKILWQHVYREYGATIVGGVDTDRCHFYMIRSLGYDAKTDTETKDYAMEIWRYNYFDGIPLYPVVTIAGKSSDGSGLFVKDHTYRSGFSVDPSDHYITLVRGMLGDKDYAILIRDIATGKDVYTLTLNDILKNHPAAAGDLGTGWWITTPSGVYLITGTVDGARWPADITIKRDTWETHIYDVPEDCLPGVERDASPMGDHFAYTNLVVWTGVEGDEEAIAQDAIAHGEMEHLIYADLTKGSTTTIETIPIKSGFRFSPKWLDDNNLQYTMPDGTKKTYTVPE